MDEEQEKALTAAIERKMDNVLQSMRSRDCLGKNDAGGYRSRSKFPTDVISPTTPGKDTPSIGSGVTSFTEKPMENSSGGGPSGLSVSEDNFDETFSDGSEDMDPTDNGMPVDSMANFVEPVKERSEELTGTVRSKERGIISENGAQEKDTRRPRLKIRVDVKAAEDYEPEEPNEDVEVPRSPKKKKSIGKDGKAGTPMTAAGRLMKKLTSGFRSKKGASEDKGDRANK